MFIVERSCMEAMGERIHVFRALFIAIQLKFGSVIFGTDGNSPMNTSLPRIKFR